MVFHTSASQNLAPAPGGVTISHLIQQLAVPHPPATFAFPMLGNPAGQTTSLMTGEAAAIQQQVAPRVVRSIGLITCASVCFVREAAGYVLHANTGHVTAAQFQAAMAALGAGAAGPYPDVWVAYAHPNATDDGYQQTLDQIVAWGVPTGQVVEITDLFLSQFGLNNDLCLGY